MQFGRKDIRILFLNDDFQRHAIRFLRQIDNFDYDFVGKPYQLLLIIIREFNDHSKSGIRFKIRHLCAEIYEKY
jgi:hypothetical protein